MSYKELTGNTTKLGTLTVKLNVDTKAFQLAILEERYKMKVRILNDLEQVRVKQNKELSSILNKIYSLKESTN